MNRLLAISLLTLTAFFGLLSSPLILLAAMSDSKAMTEAIKIWGPPATLARVRTSTDANWFTQIGFKSPSCPAAFTVVGEGFNTWDAAFASMPADHWVLGTYSGSVVLHLVIDLHNMTDPPTLQVLLDGEPLGPSISPVPPIVDVPWDTTMSLNGSHVVCTVLSTVDATSSKAIAQNSHASVAFVKN